MKFNMESHGGGAIETTNFKPKEDREFLKSDVDIRFLTFEESFEKRDDPEIEESIVRLHERQISNPEYFIGAGNNATVYDNELDKGLFCTKKIWRDAEVEIKDKRYDLLSPYQQELRKISKHFESVREKRRKLVSERGVNFIDQNAPDVEAMEMFRAHLIAEQAGLGQMVPKPFNVVEFEQLEEEDEVEGHPYYINEKFTSILMEKVRGLSIQDLILEHEKHDQVIQDIDIDQWSNLLGKLFDAFDEYNFTHNDITIRNIMIDFKSLEPRLIDFGTSGINRISADAEKDRQGIEQALRWLKRLKKNGKECASMLQKNLDDLN